MLDEIIFYSCGTLSYIADTSREEEGYWQMYSRLGLNTAGCIPLVLKVVVLDM